MILDDVKALKKISSGLPSLGIDTRNLALENIAKSLESSTIYILEQNKLDLESGKNISQSLYKRLILSEKKINEMVSGIRSLITLDDPLGKVQLNRELDSNLVLTRFSVPIGVIGVIFESRPDALVQISSLLIKSGNCGILKGGKEAINTNKALFGIILDAIKDIPLLSKALVLAESREDIRDILLLDDYIDLMIPRGSNELVQYIKNNTKIPVMGHADGICHVYIDSEYDLQTAINVTIDSKCQYPAVCNAVENLLIHKDSAQKILLELKNSLEARGVELRGCDRTAKIINVNKASEEDWDTEYNDLILSIKIVDSIEEAIDFVNTHGSGHTDCIVTTNNLNWELFLTKVDSASVFRNASTRFADGNRYGFGAEVGISTYKIHSRGPVGLEGLTIYKYKLVGNGHIVADYATGKKTFTHRDIK
jgi:glutamate-5-semialdehyde dehydrogenase